ncbi:MAG: CBS domain-containing protein [Cyclobacteriaceae bacterium]|nr:CBS domain-containing protein [Cyclobacteriaceae bacterium HetDA_MAG_MS6]
MNFTGKREEADTKAAPQYESVTRYMAKKLVTFKPEQPIHEAIDIMLEKKISGGPVLGENDELVGMLSEKDCLKILVDRAYHNQPNQKSTVSDYMTENVETIDIDKDVLDVANLFLSNNFRRYPVVQDGKLKGQVSRRDIMRATRELKGTTW